MASAGDAFKCNHRPFHVYVVITTPDAAGKAVIVNLTDKDNDEDRSCVLGPADYPEYITKPTIVIYRRGGDGSVSALENSEDFAPMPKVSAATLRKIQEGALVADALAQECQDKVRGELRCSRHEGKN